VSTGGPDLFVICKSCGSEVSPYITECPYCGNRLRKRAPKLDRHGRVAEPPRRRSPTPSLPRLRRGEIPGIRADSHPYGTLVLLVASFAGCMLYRAAAVGSTVATDLWFKNGTHMWWRLLVAPFTYANTGDAFVSLSLIGVFGWLLERRHGPILVLALFAAGGIGGQAVSIAVFSGHEYLGAQGAALALMAAWAVPDLITFRREGEVEGDVIGIAVLTAVLAILPLASPEASYVSLGVGLLAGLILGYPLARIQLR
jgi:membrane associated rhomboid family serine protease